MYDILLRTGLPAHRDQVMGKGGLSPCYRARLLGTEYSIHTSGAVANGDRPDRVGGITELSNEARLKSELFLTRTPAYYHLACEVVSIKDATSLSPGQPIPDGSRYLRRQAQPL